MCVGVPAQIIGIVDSASDMATVEIGGIRRDVNISCVVGDGRTHADCVGAWVLVHVGFAMSLIDEEEAMKTLELLRHGRAVEGSVERSEQQGIHRLLIDRRIEVRRSTWLAARGTGSRIRSLDRDSDAHRGAVEVRVGDRSIRSASSARHLRRLLRAQKAHYREHGRYENDRQRRRVMDIFDRAISRLEHQSEAPTDP